MLYAGTTPLFIFKHSILNDTVKVLKLGSQSAGNNIVWLCNLQRRSYYKNGTSETLRNETVIINENVKKKKISEHVPTHLKPVKDESFGQYLAGLIEGNGNFSSQQELVIVFNSLDASLAYYIKKRLGFGSVKRVKDKNSFLFIFVLTAKKGIEKVIKLINGKYISEDKYNQINNNILNQRNFAEFKKEIDFKFNKSSTIKNNHWLAGFSDAIARFHIDIITNSVELKFNLQHKNKDILLLIKNYLGGNIQYSQSKDTYIYDSTSLDYAKNVINYFDHYHLLSSKHVNFLKWRKAYLIIQNNYNINNLDKL